MALSRPQPRLLFVAPSASSSSNEAHEFARGLSAAYDGEIHLITDEDPDGSGEAFEERVLAEAAARADWTQVVHLADASLGMMAPRLADVTSAPVVVSVHGDDLPRDSETEMASLTVALRDPRIRVVADCPTIAEEIERRLGATPVVITPGVETNFWGKVKYRDRRHVDEFRRKHLELPVGPRLILSRGELIQRRGVSWFVREVLPQLPEDVRYVIAGSGEDEAAVRALDDPRVIWSPVRLLNESAALLYCVDLAVFPNLPSPEAPEGFRLAVSEASAVGTPVLLADIEGCSDTAAALGLTVVAAADARAWVDAVRGALVDPPRHTRAATPWNYCGFEYLMLYRESADLPA